MNPELTTLIVVAYHLDFAMLRRFIASVVQHWRHDQLVEIIVVLNDNHRYRAEFNAVLDSFQPEEIRIRRIWANEIWPGIDHYDWCSQQQLKLMIATHVTTDWYIIQDCKDFYTGPVSIDTFWAQGWAVECLSPMDYFDTSSGAGIFTNQYRNAYKIWGLDFSDHRHLPLKYTTPFQVRTDVIQDMLSDLRAKMGGAFDLLLHLEYKHHYFVTEFALISGYVTHRGLLEELYAPRENTYRQSNELRSSTDRNKDLRGK